MSGNTELKLQYIKDTRDLIKDAIDFVGIPITAETPFRDYANLINQLSYIIPLEKEVIAYTIGLAEPVAIAQVEKINDFVKSVKTGLSINLLSEFFDLMYIFAVENSELALRDLVGRNFDAQVSGTPTFTSLEGFNGAGTAYINTLFNAYTSGVNYTQNNAAYGIYSRTNANENRIELGADDGTSFSYFKANNGGKFQGRINSADGTLINNATADSLGMHIVSRNGALATEHYGYKNKTTYTTLTGSADTVGVPNKNFYLLGMNSNGTFISGSNKQISFAFFSKHISEAQRDILVDAFEAYMDSNSKGVIA